MGYYSDAQLFTQLGVIANSFGLTLVASRINGIDYLILAESFSYPQEELVIKQIELHDKSKCSESTPVAFFTYLHEMLSFLEGYAFSRRLKLINDERGCRLVGFVDILT
jgi:hypothetical protein